MRLGQHFLIHSPTLEKIAEVVDPQADEMIVEVGPGHGELTEELRIRNKELRIIAIEKDKELSDSLKKRFQGEENIEIISGDALEILPRLARSSQLKTQSYKLVGNIPYYLTGHLLRIIGGLEPKPARTVFLIQKEVALRITAKPSRMNLLSASIQIWAEPKIILRVSRGHFKPQPQVDSAVIVLTPRPNAPAHKELIAYYRFIRILFKQPRKMVLNNLRPLAQGSQEIVQKLKKEGIDPSARPQNLTIDELQSLAPAFK